MWGQAGQSDAPLSFPPLALPLVVRGGRAQTSNAGCAWWEPQNIRGFLFIGLENDTFLCSDCCHSFSGLIVSGLLISVLCIPNLPQIFMNAKTNDGAVSH